MSASRKNLRLGFLTALEQPADCFVGGLLVTNHLGRPLEFQCTTPVKPNGTQRILYGPTLKPFVLAELIGRTLFERADVKPDVLIVNDPDLLLLREHIECPIACLQIDQRVPVLVGAEPGAEDPPLAVGQQQLRVHHGHALDSKTIRERCHLLPEQADLKEPFERVREALLEVLSPGAVR